jgi:uncharacterized protein YhdP
MSEDRLDRIESALESIQQRLDNQVAVNAELRTSTQELRASAEALLQVATIHQHNFERLTAELNADRKLTASGNIFYSNGSNCRLSNFEFSLLKCYSLRSKTKSL